MSKRRRILLLGLAFFAVGLVWTVWAVSVGLEEMHTPISDRTETLDGIALSLIAVGVLTMVGAFFTRKEP